MDIDSMDSMTKNSFSKNNNIPTNLLKHLDSEKGNAIFNNFKKWILWNNKKLSDNTLNSIVPKTDLSRIGFTTLEPSGYNVYANPSSILTKYDLWCNHNLEHRDYMWTAIDNMVNSKKESERVSKIDPMVGGVLVDESGYVIASSFRGKNEPKGHCEYNLLEHEIEPKFIKRKYKVADGLPGAGSIVTELNLRNSVLFVTLEPCSDRNTPKCSCADRIIYSGIKTVFVGLKDPDKTVDGNGIKKMEDAGITVKYFHQDLLFEIIKAKNEKGEQQNIEFIKSKRQFYLKEQPELFLNSVLEV